MCATTRPASLHRENLDMKNIRGTVSEASPGGKMRSWVQSVVLAAMAMMLPGCAGGVKDTSRSFSGVVLDAGHGGHDNGASTRYGGREKDLDRHRACFARGYRRCFLGIQSSRTARKTSSTVRAAASPATKRQSDSNCLL